MHKASKAFIETLSFNNFYRGIFYFITSEEISVLLINAFDLYSIIFSIRSIKIEFLAKIIPNLGLLCETATSI